MLDGLKATLSGLPDLTTQHLKSLILSETQIRRTTISRSATSILQGSLLVENAFARAMLQRGAGVAMFTAGPVIGIASETWSAQTVHQEGVPAHVHGRGYVGYAHPTHPGRRSLNAQAAKSCIARTGVHTSKAVRFAAAQDYAMTALKRSLKMIRNNFYSHVRGSPRSAGYAAAISAMAACPAYRGARAVVTATAIGVDGPRRSTHAKPAHLPCAGIALETGMIAGSA